MSEIHKLRTQKDLIMLFDACGDFKDLRIVTMNQSADPYGEDFPGGILTLYLSGKDIPMVKMVFHGVICWKIDNSSILNLDFGGLINLKKVTFWHEHSSADEKRKTATTSWILAKEIEWQCVKDQFE